MNWPTAKKKYSAILHIKTPKTKSALQVPYCCSQLTKLIIKRENVKQFCVMLADLSNRFSFLQIYNRLIYMYVYINLDGIHYRRIVKVKKEPGQVQITS